MGITDEDIVTILSDKRSESVGRALQREAEKITKHVNIFSLEDYGVRPLNYLPHIIKKSARASTATIWTAGSFINELESVRMPFCKCAINGGRHAHMVGVTESIFKRGLSGDYVKLYHFTEKIKNIVKDVDTILIKTDKGTDLKVKVGKYKWVASAGILHTLGTWHNLPDGEVFTAPHRMSGTAVVDGTLGDYFDSKYRPEHTQKYPLTLEIENKNKPVLTRIECEDRDLKQEFEDYVDQDPYSRIIGEIGLGTNLFLESLMGNMLIDEKYPGVHIAFGDPIGNMTGADWSCPTHLDVIMKDCNTWAGDLQIMEDGEYLIDEVD
ncbi:MAG: aminopeptidase [Thermoplasmata archaeon]